MGRIFRVVVAGRSLQQGGADARLFGVTRVVSPHCRASWNKRGRALALADVVPMRVWQLRLSGLLYRSIPVVPTGVTPTDCLGVPRLVPPSPSQPWV